MSTKFKFIVYLFLFIFLFLGFCLPSKLEASFSNRDQLTVIVFFLPACKACHKVMDDIIPPIALIYGSKVRWEYRDIDQADNYRQYLSLGNKLNRKLGTPTIVVGNRVLVGVAEAADSLEKFIAEELKNIENINLALDAQGIDLLARFKSFGPLAIVGAGLVDGVNPCAFTVIVFFISFLTFAGYRRYETAVIGAFYIFAVFLTYLALGFGFFKALYMMRSFRILSKIVYASIGGASIFLGLLALKDYAIFKKTGKADGMALQLPKIIKNKIHSIVGEYYRKDKAGRQKALFGLGISALVVGFLISLLEAVCTGQLYLPTIIFVLKEGTLRIRALSYLIIYNIMFIIPLVFVLLAALFGVSSNQFEGYAKKHLGLVKLLMALVFIALGSALIIGI